MLVALDPELLASLARAMPVGLFVIQSAVITWCSDAFAALTDLPADQIVGQPFTALVAPEDRPFVVDRYRRRLAGEPVPDHYEFSVLGATSGARRPVYMLVKVVRVGETSYSIGVVVDNTAQAQLAAGLLPDRPAAAAPATPILRVAPGVLVVPFVGHFHAARIQGLTHEILAAIQQQGARALILDLTGLLGPDLRIADYLARTAASARLLGARCLLAGVAPELAQILAGASDALAEFTTAATLEDALRRT